MQSLRFPARTSTPSVRYPRSSSKPLLHPPHAFVAQLSLCPVIPVIALAETDTRHCRGSTPANYTLKYNLMPFVGILTYGEAARVTGPIEFPLARERVE